MNDSNNKLIINSTKDILNTVNRKKYTKLILNKHVSKLNLNSFKNVKELTYVYHHDYLSEQINKLSFAKNLEKLTFKGMKSIGTDYYTKLILPNLKTIEFPETLQTIDENYLAFVKIKELIFNISNDTKFLNDSFSSKKYLNLNGSLLEKIIIRTSYKTYNIIPDYEIEQIGNSGYFNDEGIILNYKNYYIDTKVSIRNDIVNINNRLTNVNDEFIKNGCFYIPDYINSIDLSGQYNFKEINSVSLSINHIVSGYTNNIDFIYFIPDLKEIIIRNSNDMKLNPSIVISEEEYGKIHSVYIKDKKLNIYFKDKLITIDNNGLKIITEGFNKEENNVKINTNINNSGSTLDECALKKYSSTQLEYYGYYKHLVELLNDKEDVYLNDAMDVIENRLVKKLKLDE